MTAKRIILIGPMGAGKSTIGRLLSEELNLDFVDSDREIEQRSGVSIPWIFDLEGEEGFRERESQILADLMAEPAKVVATGGGAVLRPENRALLRSAGCVVYLKTSVEQQLVRTAKDKNRPLLQNDHPDRVLRDMAARRNPLYSETAHVTIDTDGLSPRAVVRTILRKLKRYLNNEAQG